MSSYQAGFGLKKPLNMLQNPILSDLKQGPPIFQNAGRFWNVDVGQTLIDTEGSTFLLGDSILSKSYRDNIDKYGQSSHQEKIAVFRPPLQNSYEDFGPLNRLPTKLHAITPHVNPGTVSDGGGTTAYAVNNSALQEVDRYVSDDKVTVNTWKTTFYRPMDKPTDMMDIILPDLVTVLPACSMSSGFQSNVKIDAPTDTNKIKLSIDKPKISGFAGVNNRYTVGMHRQTASYVDLKNTTPVTSAASGFYSQYTVDGETRVNDIILNSNLPAYSITSGNEMGVTLDGPNALRDITLMNNVPSVSVSAGYIPITTFDGETHFARYSLDESITSKLNIMNPGSEIGYQTRMTYYTPPEEYLKLRENPRVATAAAPTYQYKDNSNINTKIHFQSPKIQPVKTYNNGLRRGYYITSWS